MIDVNKFIQLKKDLESVNAQKQEVITRQGLLREQVTAELAALGISSIEDLGLEIDRLTKELESTAIEAYAYLEKSKKELGSIANG